MLKKLLLVLTILTTSLFSFQVDIWKEDTNAILNFNKYYDNVGGDEGSNWVAIYKAGDSNDWDNVITWSWANDLVHNEAGNYDERVLPLVTDEGDYEVRFFLNNSYDVFATYAYSVGEHNNASISIAEQIDNRIIFNSTNADQAWIGIYNVGDSNDWDNVQEWRWVDARLSSSMSTANLPSGNYEARLFYNNSYEVEATVSFTKDGGNNNQANLEINNQSNSSITFNSTTADQAWIGIYNKGDSNDWDNVQAWNWVDNPTMIDISNLSSGNYEARLFYNNSYDVETTLEFTKDGNGNIKKLLISKSTDKNNDGDIDKVISYTYHDNGKLKTENNGHSTNHYNDHGDIVKYKSDDPDFYRYFYNNIGKIEKRETLNADGTVKSFLRYEYNSHGDRISIYKNNENKTEWYSTYDYDANGNILKRENFINLDPYQDDLDFTETFKYDDQNRVIEYYADSYDSNPTHHKRSYNNSGKEVKRIDLSYDDDGVSYDHYYEYDNEGYLIVEKIDSHDFPDHLEEGNTDTVIYYKWQ